MDETFHLTFYKGPITFDPRKCGDIISSHMVFLLFKGLTRLQANGEVVLDLAESFHISNAGKRYVFQLGEHYWNNGSPITAFDVEFSWKTVLNPSFPALSPHLFFPIKNARKAKHGQLPVEEVGVFSNGPKQLIVELEESIPHFLELTSFNAFFPIPRDSEAQFFSPSNEFVCSGPFELSHWAPETEILLTKNRYARNPFPTSLGKIKIAIISDVKQAFSLFQNKKLDWFGEPLSQLPLNHLPAFLEEWHIHPIAGLTLCFFNTQQLPFRSRCLRQAFSYAIEREQLLQKLSIPQAVPAKGFVPSILRKNGLKSLSQGAAKRPCRLTSDATLALRLFQKGLKEVHLNPKQLRLTLTFEATEIWWQVAKCLQKNWEEAFSLTIDLEPLEFKAFYDRLSKGQYTLALGRWMAQYTSPMNILERFRDRRSGKNFSQWEDRAYQDILKRCLAQTNEHQQQSLIDQAESLLLQELPAAPIYCFSYAYFKKPYVQNLLFSPVGRIYLEQVFFEESQTEHPNPSPIEKELVYS
jgi:oligopeptide transport system substrate-binding protein